MVNKPFKYLKGNFTMATAQEILGNPYKRTTATYRFKVTHIEGNVVHYHDASMETNVQELPNDDVRTLGNNTKIKSIIYLSLYLLMVNSTSPANYRIMLSGQASINNQT